MAYPANLRGWGPGWPTNRSRDQVWVYAPRSSARWQVHWRVAPILRFVVETIESNGYLFDYGPHDTDDDWGFNNRAIGGTRTPSDHSWGLAVDIDAQNYPWGTRRNPPKWIRDLFEMYGWEWGGNYRKPDPMHFSFVGSTSEADHIVAMLAAGHMVNQPAPVPSNPPGESEHPLPVTEPPRGADPMNMVLCAVKDSPHYGRRYVITPEMQRIYADSQYLVEKYDRWIRWWGGRYDRVTDAGEWMFLMSETRPRDARDRIESDK